MTGAAGDIDHIIDIAGCIVPKSQTNSIMFYATKIEE